MLGDRNISLIIDSIISSNFCQIKYLNLSKNYLTNNVNFFKKKRLVIK